MGFALGRKDRTGLIVLTRKAFKEAPCPCRGCSDCDANSCAQPPLTMLEKKNPLRSEKGSGCGSQQKANKPYSELQEVLVACIWDDDDLAHREKTNLKLVGWCNVKQAGAECCQNWGGVCEYSLTTLRWRYKATTSSQGCG